MVHTATNSNASMRVSLHPYARHYMHDWECWEFEGGSTSRFSCKTCKVTQKKKQAKKLQRKVRSDSNAIRQTYMEFRSSAIQLTFFHQRLFSN